MLESTLLILLLGVDAYAHTTFTTLYVDGVSQGDGVCIRKNPYRANTSFPVEPLSSKEIACGYDGKKGVPRVCPAKANSTLTFGFHEGADESVWSIDPSHKGPCAVYMKKVESAIASNNAAGDGWFKIWEYSYDQTAKKWCTEKIIENNGHMSVTIPEDIEGGYYLVRPELLALHAAQDHPPDPQFYVGCAQIFLESAGTARPSTVYIGEGAYNLKISSMTYNIYATPLALPYPMYGPPVYVPGVKPSATPETQISAQEKNTNYGDGCNDTGYDDHSSAVGSGSQEVPIQTEGLKPAGCILERDNWCAFEVPDYNTQESCWQASQNCWIQSKACWNLVTPVDWSPCKTWDNKCHSLDRNCNRGLWYGPPNKGKVLTPAARPLVGSKTVFQ